LIERIGKECKILTILYKKGIMKNQVKKSKVALWGAVLLGSVILLSSCLKNKDDYVQPVAAISLINGYSGNASVDFYLDNQKVNTQPILYEQNTEYIQVYSGTRRITVTNSGTTKILADGGLPLSSGKYYSVFLAKTSETSTDSISGRVVEDDLNVPTGQKAKIRFANLTPGDDQIDVFIEGVADSLFGKRPFLSISAFKEVDPGTKNFQIKATGNPDVKLPVQLTLQPGKIYTLSTNGLWNGTPTNNMDAFGTQLTTHN
jgi:hypothetical protein